MKEKGESGRERCYLCISGEELRGTGCFSTAIYLARESMGRWMDVYSDNKDRYPGV